ncbi:uncharacterized protein LOC134535135 [Bacillus rossius redtenbacheri]|uniref:uncharacterized protein LOC134535135 n=1 Tax=Bacillus rossius redtenbacheri TaxID=93214 RepID=UPI002FDF0884
MEQVDAAEKEASEVLHKLLSVERIEKPNYSSKDHNQVMVVVTCAGSSAPSGTDARQSAVQWATQPVTLHHSLFGAMTGDDCSEDEGGARKRSSSSGDEAGASEPKKPAPREREAYADMNQLEDNVLQVRERLARCCECQEQNCFKGLNPESVYRHRLNIAELTKEEHDMYLMGVTMAVLTNPELTVRHKERRRLRSQYVFQGRRVCLDAFLYLENCTHYHLKRIRKHVMTRGVVPRVHGNHGKKPHNTFSLDIYRHATMFLKHFVKTHTSASALPAADQPADKQKTVSKTPPLYLPPEVTRKTIHNAYREYCELFEPTIKVMGYSTFRHFMKEQFPHVKFAKVETSKPSAGKAGGEAEPRAQGSAREPGDSAEDSEGPAPPREEVDVKIRSLPVVFSEGAAPQDKPTTFIVAPVSHGGEGYPFQLAGPAQCFSQPEVETITVTPVIGNTLTAAYSFTAL